MKNIHILPTDKPSRLHYSGNNSNLLFSKEPISFRTFKRSPQNIYITSDEEIQIGDLIFDIVTKRIEIAKFDHNTLKRDWRKIILTTDQDIIKDGVQPIDDEFLEWFVSKANDSGKAIDIVEIEKWTDYKLENDKEVPFFNYKIILPKEEPKQETLEEVAERFVEAKQFRTEEKDKSRRYCFIQGAKWMQEKSYSEEEVKNAFTQGFNARYKMLDGIESREEFMAKLKKK